MIINGFANRTISALIFDMNGVIINDEHFHQESWREYCRNHHLHIPESTFKTHVFGRTEKETFEFLYNRPLSPEEIAKSSDERVDLAIEMFKPNLTATKGLLAFLEYLKTHNIPTAVATSLRTRYTAFILDSLKIRNYFSAVITAEGISRGKPDPEIYLKAAEALQVAPERCLAIEDSISGIKAAESARMLTFGLATTHSRQELSIADQVVDDFDQLLTQVN